MTMYGTKLVQGPSTQSGTTIMQDVLSYLGVVLSLFRKTKNTKEIPSIKYVDRTRPLDPTDPAVFDQWINLAVNDTRTLEEYCYTDEHIHVVLKQLYTAHAPIRNHNPKKRHL